MTAILQQPSGATPSPDEIRDYLARLLAAASFQASPRRRKLLAYVVEQTLAGRGDRLKAFDLALAVLGRDERFDAQNDPIVRIEVGRLRRDLEQYYASAGRDDPIRITIPKGHYVPAFEVAEHHAPPQPAATAPGRRGWRPALDRRTGLAAGLCLLLLVALGWRWVSWGAVGQAQSAGPAVVVLPFEPLAGGEDAQLLASGLTMGLIAELMRYDGMEVFAGQPPAPGKAEVPPAAAQALTYLVHGTVDREPGRVRVTAALTDRNSGLVLWSKSYERGLTTTDIFDVQSELSTAIVGGLAQGDGVITQAAARQLQRNRPETLFAYDCVQRAFAYRRSFAKELYPPVRACLEEAVRRDPNYAAAWAMLGFAHMDAVRWRLVEPSAKAAEMQAGLAAAQHALDLAPGGIVGLRALAALRFANGEFEEAERLQREAVALNPHNPELLAQLGYRLAIRGRIDEGRPLLEEAIARSVVVPAWYHQTLAVTLYLGGDLAGARDAAEAGRQHCCGVGQATLALTEAALGHTAAARAALGEAMRQSTLLARDPVAFWADFQGSPEVIQRLNVGLAKAGLELPPAAAEANSRS